MTPAQLEKMLSALGEHLAGDEPPMNLVVCGGAALNALGFVDRPTKGVDVVAIMAGDGPAQLISATPLPAELVSAKRVVAEDFGEPENWLNDGPASLVRLGLPEGCTGRFVVRRYGDRLFMHYMAREDLICLKLYAYADTGTPRHRDDLKALSPSVDELRRAKDWVLTQVALEGFKEMLQAALRNVGGGDVATELG